MQGLTVLVVDEICGLSGMRLRDIASNAVSRCRPTVGWMGRRPDGQGAATGFNSAWSWFAEVARIRNRETDTNAGTQAKPLFVSQTPSADVIREALSLGARGCVDRTHTSTDLLPAIEAVLRGKQFVSEILESRGGTDAPRRHEVQFYSSDSVLLETFARVLATALEFGGAAIALATKSHREGLVRRLQAGGFDVDVAMRQGTYLSRDAADTLSTMMVNGVPDGARFLEGLTGFIASAAKAAKKEHPRIAICGECIGLLCSLGNTNAAIRLEKVGNDLVKTQHIDIMCAYPLRGFRGGKDVQVFRSICREHTAVYSR